jgi:hypothetical protein
MIMDNGIPLIHLGPMAQQQPLCQCHQLKLLPRSPLDAETNLDAAASTIHGRMAEIGERMLKKMSF